MDIGAIVSYIWKISSIVLIDPIMSVRISSCCHFWKLSLMARERGWRLRVCRVLSFIPSSSLSTRVTSSFTRVRPFRRVVSPSVALRVLLFSSCYRCQFQGSTRSPPSGQLLLDLVFPFPRRHLVFSSIY